MALEVAKLYSSVVDRVVNMVGDAKVQEMAKGHGLGVMSVTWEDTARFKGSCVGPNISDMSVQVIEREANRLQVMPLIRYPNYADKTADVNIDRLFVKVGNHAKEELKTISLREYLTNITQYMSKPRSGEIKGSLVLDRDTHVLASAQAAFLPVPKTGKAEFNVVLFNYQARPGDPAVLTILATGEGTSATVIDNKRDKWETGQAGCWGQRLFHNDNGQRCAMTGERLTDFIEAKGGTAADVEAAKDKGLDVLMMIQVPLKQKPPPRPTRSMSKSIGSALDGGRMYAMCASAGASRGLESCDVEQAVLGHGDSEGPYTEFDGLTLERDERFPIRVTVQMYKATSNGVVDEKAMLEVTNQINRVYADGDWVGSLVTGGNTTRPTEHSAERIQPVTWWGDFWKNHAANMNVPEERVVRKLDELWPDKSWHHFSMEEMDRVARSGRLA